MRDLVLKHQQAPTEAETQYYLSVSEIPANTRKFYNIIDLLVNLCQVF